METVIVKSDKDAIDNEIYQRKPSFFSSTLKLNTNKALIPDGGYGWVVVLATFFIYAIAEGISFVFGLLYIEFLQEFRASKAATSWIGSLFVALPLVSGPVWSALVDLYGCQKMTILGSLVCAFGFVLSSYANSIGLMYVTYGVVGGLSRGICYITVVVSVAYWFDKKRSLALGISASGTGFGTLVFAPFTTFLLSEHGWRGTQLILGGCLANMCVCGALMVDPKWVVEEELKEKKRKKQIQANANMQQELDELLENGKPTTPITDSKKKKWFDDIIKTCSSFSLFIELHFSLLALTTLLSATWFLIPYFYLAQHMIDNGYSEDQASMTVSIIGIMNMFGMILLGWIGDKWSVSKTFAISLILCGISIWGIIFFTNNYTLISICSGLFGFFFSSCFSLTPSLLAELVNMDDFTMGFGLILLCEGTGHLIGPPLAAYISDVSKSWSMSFYQAGLWIVVAGISLGIIPFTKNRRFFGKVRREKLNST